MSSENGGDKVIPPGTTQAEFLKSLHRPGVQAFILKDGTVSYRDGRPKKAPRFSRAQIAGAIARIDAGEERRAVYADLGMKSYHTLNDWIRKYRERPELWDASELAAEKAAAGGAGAAP